MMKKVYDEVDSLDRLCYTKYNLTEDILMEHAANGIVKYIEKKFDSKSKILIVSGGGNNGADGIVAARLLQQRYKVKLYIPFGVKSTMAKIQYKRVCSLGIKIVKKIPKADIVVDALFGSGLNRELDIESIKLIEKLNRLKAYKISCDIPSGIDKNGVILNIAFKADTTITMGGLKRSLFSDTAKDYVGKIKIANLGLSSKIYQKSKTNIYLLDKKDMILPIRKQSNTHKGVFGHLSVVAGDKIGAAILCSKAGFYFGAGLTTIISKSKLSNIPSYIMESKSLPNNTTAISIGMGLGESFDKSYIQNDIPKLIDADLFYKKEIINILNSKNIVLTPHPKEFCGLLKVTNIADISVDQLQNDRFGYLMKFMEKYPYVTVVLKGANTLIGSNQKIYINRYGTQALSKGGSGDILAGLISSLLAQGYSPKKAAISGVLAHSIAGSNYKGANYSLGPNSLMKQIKKLHKSSIKKI